MTLLTGLRDVIRVSLTVGAIWALLALHDCVVADRAPAPVAKRVLVQR